MLLCGILVEAEAELGHYPAESQDPANSSRYLSVTVDQGSGTGHDGGKRLSKLGNTYPWAKEPRPSVGGGQKTPFRVREAKPRWSRIGPRQTKTTGPSSPR